METGKDKTFDLLGELTNYQAKRADLNWDKHFPQYFEKVIDKPGLVRTSHQLLLGAVTSREDFFITGENALYGMENTTRQLVETLGGAAKGLDVRKRIMLFVGPPGGGKSSLVNSLKRGLEQYSQTDDGAIYAIADCPMHEEPLHLIPMDLRPKLKDQYGIQVEGDLCPQCRFTYQGDKPVDLNDIAVKRILLSEANRVGIGTFKPSDPKSQDITELVGSINLAKLPLYGTGSDPRAYSFDGELNKANRGLMEFVEMLKVDDKFLYALLDLAQDSVIKPPRFPNVPVDEVIIGHTNEEEYRKFTANQANEAMKDRLILIGAPYVLNVEAETKIYDKLIASRAGAIHISPMSMKAAATFSVLSRLKAPVGPERTKEFKIYSGQYVEGFSGSERDIKKLHETYPKEGMDGVSPRFIINALSNALMQPGLECLDPMNVLTTLREAIVTSSYARDMSKEEKEALLAVGTAAKELYEDDARTEVQAAFVHSVKEAAATLFDNYIKNIDAFLDDIKIEDPITREEKPANEKLMRSIEEQLNVADSARKEFRSDVNRTIGRLARKGEAYDYRSHPRLKEAIDKKLFLDMKDYLNLLGTSATPNKEQKEKIDSAVSVLKDEKGYCAVCANALLRYIGNQLDR